MDSAGLVVSERHRDYRISACCPCRPEPDIVGSWCNLGEEVHVHHVGLQRMRRVQDSADTCLDVEETAVDAFEQKMIPAILAPFFVLFYLEGVLTSALQALGHAKITMNITLWGVILKLLVMAILSLCHIGIYSLVIAEIINILFVVLINFKYLKIYV